MKEKKGMYKPLILNYERGVGEKGRGNQYIV